MNAGSGQPLRLCRRADIETACRQVRGRRHYVLKDPVALKFHQLNEEEHFLWQLLDGRRTETEIRDAYRRRFPRQRLTPTQLEQFVSQLHRDSLVLADAPEQGEVLRRRGQRATRQERWRQFSNPLAIRLPGLDPRPLLRCLRPVGQAAFSTPGFVVSAALIAACLLLAGAHFREFQLRLTETHYSPATFLLAAALSLALLKVLHELGHALLCQRFQRECHELGMMLLVFTPCLYCNVTDSWMLSDKWKRAAVAAAGIWVELVLAAVGGVLWWVSEPGLFHTLCLHVMVIGSVNSLFINGNPLLRLDGYYVLSDLSEFPNLAQRSHQALWDRFLRLLGAEPQELGESAADRRWLETYGVLSLAYRLAVLAAILTACYLLLKPYRMQSLAVLIGIAAVVRPAAKLAADAGRAWQNPLARRNFSTRRFVVTSTIAATLAAAVLSAPLPRSISGNATVQFDDERVVRVQVEGRLIQAVAEGAEVRQGDVIARLENDTLRRRLADLEEQRLQLRLQLEELQALRGTDPTAADRVPELTEQLAGAERELHARRADVERLVLKAPRSGAVLAPLQRPEPDPDDGQLPGWAGTPLQPRNRGSLLEHDTEICRIGDPRQRCAIVRVDAAGVEAVAPDQPVRLQFATTRGVLTGRVARIAQRATTAREQTGVALDRATSFEILVKLDNPEFNAPHGSNGVARIQVSSLSLGARWGRWLARTFRRNV
ncbi:MAG: hypothetical protein KDB14_10795 [Planctomycetales bacterium]|nr:hypothetical protein [Planctomycetales bacterium]